MKNTARYLGMAAIIAATVFFMAACGPKPGPDPQSLIITGINSTYNGKFVFITLFDGDNKVAWAIGTISNGSVTGELLDWVTDEEWRESGTYTVILLIYDSRQAAEDEDDPLWMGGIVNVPFNQATTSVSFSSLVQKSDNQKSITITNIPTTHNGRFALIGLYDSSNALTAFTYGYVSNGSVTGALIDNSKNPWTNNGSFKVSLLLYASEAAFTNDPDSELYTGWTTSQVNITQQTTTVNWSTLTEITDGPGGDDPIALTIGVWSDEHNLATKDDEVWFTFDVSQGATYYVWVNDAYTGSSDGYATKTGWADVVTSAYYGSKNGTVIFTGSDAGDNDSTTNREPNSNFTATGNTTVYLKVNPLSSPLKTGLFKVCFTTNSTRPGEGGDPIALTIGTWSDEANLASKDEEAWYTFNVTNGSTYYFWNKSYFSFSSSDAERSQWADVYTDLHYSSKTGTTVWTNKGDGYNTTGYSFTANQTGTMYIRVVSNQVPAQAQNGKFQVAVTTTNTRPGSTPPVPTGVADMIGTFSAGNHGLAIDNTGKLYAWGGNQKGAVGDGTTTNSGSPVKIGDANWKSVSAGLDDGSNNQHSVGIQTNGTLWVWGANNYGQLGDGTTTDVTTGPKQIGDDTTWVSVSAGRRFTVAVKSNGSLWAWGENVSGQTGLNTTTGNTLTPTQVGLDTDWKFVSAGRQFVAAIKTDGSLWTWGANTSGQLGQGNITSRSVPTRVGADSNWKFVSAGDYHALAIKSDGSLWTWGSNLNGATGLDTQTDNTTSPTRIGTASDWAIVSAGNAFSTAINTGGLLYSWGENSLGKTGQNETTGYILTPKQVGTDTDWKAVSASRGSSFALATDTTGKIYSWGSGYYGNTGQGSTSNTNTLVPTQIASLTVMEP